MALIMFISLLWSVWYSSGIEWWVLNLYMPMTLMAYIRFSFLKAVLIIGVKVADIVLKYRRVWVYDCIVEMVNLCDTWLMRRIIMWGGGRWRESTQHVDTNTLPHPRAAMADILAAPSDKLRHFMVTRGAGGAAADEECIICMNVKPLYVYDCMTHRVCLDCMRDLKACPMCRIPRNAYYDDMFMPAAAAATAAE